MFTIKETAKNLNMTPQAIYKRKKELIKNGYMEKNKANQWEITTEGFNFLKDKQTQRIVNQFKQPVENIVENVVEEEKETPHTDKESDVLNLLLNQMKEQLTTLNNQLQEEREQKEYFRAKFEEKDRLLNEFLNRHLLTGQTEEEGEKKKGFFKKLFK